MLVTTARKYRKKPVVIEALLFTGHNWFAVEGFCGKAAIGMIGGDVLIGTLEGDMRAQPGDMIIKGVQGEFYPCKFDIFEQTYELVPEGEH